ncbi:carbamoyltransferase [Pelagicoccus sp. SDUM812002]|uniref:carbamoyltransferase family protein n=1 Tax=Pelagicoccus sp. SDUM812002 TaxID=3041266 RepID=UPI00280D912C|nr:carbamoyltransferase [Pelagicoccus sp. SDUM812002]MDQ8185789.1 carbamoyltransferase [Pelagicoccus sp. SDUM812002]
MTVRILGISAYYHDSAASLLVDGKIVAAAQEERFTRKKHDAGFPQHAVDYCLREGGITAGELDHVAFYEKPFLRFERLLETYLAVAPAGFPSFLKAMPQWIHQKLQLPKELNRGLDGLYRKPYVFTEHHESHAASAFFPSPFDEAAILTVDGVGEWATASLGYGKGNKIKLNHELRFPHSLGLLYSAFTYFCGFKVNSGEYKLMGLAPYGEPVYASDIREKLLDLREDGSFRLDQSYFNYCQGLTMTSKKFAALFEGPPRSPESAITKRELDLAASVQVVVEEIVLKMARHLHRISGSKNLCLAGGVALNCVANGRLLRESPFEKLWIQPAAGDAGGALGAALFTWYQLREKVRTPSRPDRQYASLLGPRIDKVITENVLKSRSAVYHFVEEEEQLCSRVAGYLAGGRVVGWVQGRMEFGPRALGSRSILGDPRSPDMQRVMNLKIKYRESFRPFAPIVKRERAAEYFDMSPEDESPYMLIVAPVNKEKRVGLSDRKMEGLERVKEVRSTIPAVTHVDYSARIQTVDTERSPRLHALLEAFESETGCPALINTSFNVRGEPIVCTAEDAFRCFMATEMDVLVIGDYILLKPEQPQSAHDERASHLARYGAD